MSGWVRRSSANIGLGIFNPNRQYTVNGAPSFALGTFGLQPGTMETGYGHTSEQVAALVPAPVEALLGYHDAVMSRSQEYLVTVTSEELGRIIDTSYDPPVSVGVRLVSVISDNIQHAGQARYVRGIYDRQ